MGGSFGGWSATCRSNLSCLRFLLAIRFLVKGSDGFRSVVRPGLKHGLPDFMISSVGHPSASSLYSGTYMSLVRSVGWSFLIASE